MSLRVLNRSVGGLVLTLLTAVGCGSDGGKSVSKFDEFLGIWQFTESVVTEMCMGQPTENLTVTGTNQWMLPGVTTDLVSPGLFADTCNFKFNVDGKSANMTTDQKCDVGAEGNMDFYAPTTGKFTLLSPTTAEESAVLEGKISFMSGATIVQLTCTLNIAGKLQKVADND